MNISTSSDGGSLKGNKSFNIRGTGKIGNYGSALTPLVLIDGMEGDINAINPQDIENISVLKDAAASSIYGSRAMYSAKKLQQIKDYQTGKSNEYMWPYSNGRWNAFDDPNREDLMPAANTDWLHALFGSSFTHEHSLSANGGTDVMQYYLSANYLDQGGLLKYGDDGKKRYSLTAKINADLAKWLKVGYSVRFNRIDYDSPSFASAGSNKSNVFYFDVCRYWPVIRLFMPMMWQVILMQ